MIFEHLCFTRQKAWLMRKSTRREDGFIYPKFRSAGQTHRSAPTENGMDWMIISTGVWNPPVIKALIFLVFVPSRRIIDNIFQNAIKFGFIPDDMFVIISLPDGHSMRTAQCVDAFGWYGLERTNQPSQWFLCCGFRRGGSRTAPTGNMMNWSGAICYGRFLVSCLLSKTEWITIVSCSI